MDKDLIKVMKNEVTDSKEKMSPHFNRIPVRSAFPVSLDKRNVQKKNGGHFSCEIGVFKQCVK